MILIVRLLFLLILLLNTNFVLAQTVDLLCKGDISVKTSDGKSYVFKNETRTYIFKNGKLLGVVDATWSDNLVIVQGPTDKEVSNCVFCNKKITINRLSGDVEDYYYTMENGIRHNWWYQGNCSSAKKKF